MTMPAPTPVPPPAPEFTVGDHVVYPTHGVGRVTGIVTVDQAPAAIAALKAEIERREAQGQGHAAPTSDDEARAQATADEFARQELVTLRQRAAPFIELLQISSAAGKDVVWGF